jgi:hypothetical protein
MDWKQLGHPCIGAVIALQVVEFGEAVHSCIPGPDEVRCESLPGRHIHFPEAPAQSDVRLFGPEITITASTSSITASTHWTPGI